MPPQTLTLAAGESRVVAWPVTVPASGDTLRYTVEASAGDSSDRLTVTQQVRDAVPVRTLQATLLRAEPSLSLPVARPADALPERGGLAVSAAASLAGAAGGVADYLRRYPYTCLEQQTSITVGLDDGARWTALAAALPAYLDGDGLLKFFPTMEQGSEVLTAYVVAVAAAAGWEIPATTRERLLAGLRGFVDGSIRRDSLLRAPDLTLRKLAAMEALTRAGAFDPALLGGIAIEPALWPTSAVLDWWSILQRVPAVPERDARLAAVEQILQSRLNLQGTTLGLSADGGNLWWLMSSTDQNAVRLLLLAVEFGVWRDDVPRLVRGALGRQQRGHWDTTPANAWGALALRRFGEKFEATPVTGVTAVRLGAATQELAWTPAPGGPAVFAWPPAPATLDVAQQGGGAPWITVTSRAAIPLSAPLSSGYRISKTVTPLEPRADGTLARGDRLRVRLDVEAQSDMTWVVFDDPVAAGVSHLGTGLARDSQLADAGGGSDLATPDFVERRFDAWRGYFQFLPKGRTSVEYVVRLNQSGRFELPPTRVEALYAPEMFGETPNAPVDVAP